MPELTRIFPSYLNLLPCFLLNSILQGLGKLSTTIDQRKDKNFARFTDLQKLRREYSFKQNSRPFRKIYFKLSGLFSKREWSIFPFFSFVPHDPHHWEAIDDDDDDDTIIN